MINIIVPYPILLTNRLFLLKKQQKEKKNVDFIEI